jgi:hypothetical protein
VLIADRRRLWALLCVVALGAAACSGDDGGPTTGLSAEPFRLDRAVGECFDRPESPDVTSVPAVPCREPHDLEVFAVFELGAVERAFPGPSSVARQAGAGCEERFADYVGVGQDSSGLLIVPYAPDRLAWESDEREVTCAVSRAEGPLEGSVRGSEAPGG